jgi:multidrug efflux pump subunit AcrA (membrane-fusion protein)
VQAWPAAPPKCPYIACRAQAAEAQLTQQLAALQSRAAALQLSDSASRGENLQLRQALHAARAAAEPSVVQLRQLLLDPGVNREFSALRAELEARSRELAAAQLQLAALQVRPDPLLVKLDRQQVGGGGGMCVCVCVGVGVGVGLGGGWGERLQRRVRVRVVA